MEVNNWRPAVAAPPDDSSDDWRKQLLPVARERIVNKIMETLKRHLPIAVPELKKIAVRFEEKIYTAATNQSDYLRKISLKMLSMETKTQGAAAINPSLSNPTIGNQSPSESVSTLTMQPVEKHTVGIPLQPASSTIASPWFMPIAPSSPTEKHSGTSKSAPISETESQAVTADQVAALEKRVAALKNRVEYLESSLSIILFALLFALFVGSYILW